MYLMKRRQTKRRKKIGGKGIKRPYINKRKRLILGKGQRGGSIGAILPVAISLLQSIFK